MKFLVSDRQADRHRRIRSFLTEETAVLAVLLAAVDFEWTIRRVLDHASGGDASVVGTGPISGLNRYAKAWGRVFKASGGGKLENVVEDWARLQAAYQLRHDLVHGRQGSSGLIYVTKRVDLMLSASIAVAAFGAQRGADPYRRLRKRGNLTGPTVTV